MSDIKESYDYVIVGAGVAAASAVQGIRSQDPSGTIAVLGSEPDKPVYRPALSKDLWLKDDATLEGNSLAGDLDDDNAVDLVTDTTVTAIDPGAHVVRLTDGSSVGYGRLLLATGAEPRTLAVEPGPRVVYYRTAADYERLRAFVDAGSRVVVVGGGYIGSEIASALVQNDVAVTLVLDLEDCRSRCSPARSRPASPRPSPTAASPSYTAPSTAARTSAAACRSASRTAPRSPATPS